MALIEYKLEEKVAVVTLNSGENRFNPAFLKAWSDTMDEIENETDALTMVVTSADEKIFCNGIDLMWLMEIKNAKKDEESKQFFYSLNQFFKRTLMSPLLTIACINGHSFAGGAIWSCAFDFRHMRSDRGYFCYPEADLNIPFLPGMIGLLKKAIPLQKMDEMVMTGERLTAEQCLENKIVRHIAHNDTLLEETLAYAQTLNKSRGYVKEMRHRLYHDIIHALEVEDIPYIESGRLVIE